jgi:hypothetical protein
MMHDMCPAVAAAIAADVYHACRVLQKSLEGLRNEYLRDVSGCVAPRVEPCDFSCDAVYRLQSL